MKKNNFKIILGCIVLLIISLVIIGFKIKYSQNSTNKDIENKENKVDVKDNITEDLQDNSNNEEKNDDANQNVNTGNNYNNTNNNINNSSNNAITDSSNNDNNTNKENNSDIKEDKPILNETIKDNLIIRKIIEVVDKSNGTCAQAIEYFYEDTNYKYYFTCIKSHSMYVIINGKEYKLVEALNNKIVTMQELEDNGYKFPKEDKNTQTK